MARLDPIKELRSIIVRWGQLAGRKDESGQRTLWGDAGNKRNSVIDAEALTIPLLPYRAINKEFDLQSEPGLETLLSGLTKAEKINAGGKAIRESLVETLTEFFAAYDCGERDIPIFTAPSYLEPCIAEGASQAERDEAESTIRQQGDGMVLIDSLTFSVSLCLYVLFFVKYRENYLIESGLKIPDSIRKLQNMASSRLTFALRGLCASFVVSTDISRKQWEEATRREWPGATKTFQLIWERLRAIGVPKNDRNEEVFECGWTWGVVQGEHLLGGSDNEYDEKIRSFTRSVDVKAEAAPYLYCTIIALDGLEELFSLDVNALNILNGEQSYLVSRLRVMADITRKYWTEIAFSKISSAQDEWGLEQLPFYPTDANDIGDTASAYWNLYLIRLILGQPDLVLETSDQQRFIHLLENLASEGRITRIAHPKRTDPNLFAYQLHGLKLKLTPDKNSPHQPAILYIYDYPPQLLKACGQMLRIVRDPQMRSRLTALIDAIWDRTLRPTHDAQQLWVDWKKKYNWYGADRDSSGGVHVSSWYFTERVLEGLVAVALGESIKPQSSGQLRGFIHDLIADIEHSVTRRGEGGETARALLDKARTVAESAPGVSLALAIQSYMKRDEQ